MQFFILFIGAMVFVFYIFEPAPMVFQRLEYNRIRQPEMRASYDPIAAQYQEAAERRKAQALAMVAARHNHDTRGEYQAVEGYRRAQQDVDAARKRAASLVEATGGEKGFHDTNYIFLSFVTKYLPTGIVGLVIAVILAATMSSSSGEINSLATVTVVDIYKRHFRKNASDHHYLTASRLATAFWGAYAVALSGFGKHLGSLIEAVNIVGSLFYGSLLGVFALAFFFRRVSGTGAFIGMIAGEAAIFAAFLFTGISFLWYNVIGCVVVIATGMFVSSLSAGTSATPDTAR
jgi:Na+(H+)/acetate symporter ActP